MSRWTDLSKQSSEAEKVQKLQTLVETINMERQLPEMNDKVKWSDILFEKDFVKNLMPPTRLSFRESLNSCAEFVNSYVTGCYLSPYTLVGIWSNMTQADMTTPLFCSSCFQSCNIGFFPGSLKPSLIKNFKNYTATKVRENINAASTGSRIAFTSKQCKIWYNTMMDILYVPDISTTRLVHIQQKLSTSSIYSKYEDTVEATGEEYINKKNLTLSAIDKVAHQQELINFLGHLSMMFVNFLEEKRESNLTIIYNEFLPMYTEYWGSPIKASWIPPHCSFLKQIERIMVKRSAPANLLLTFILKGFIENSFNAAVTTFLYNACLYNVRKYQNACMALFYKVAQEEIMRTFPILVFDPDIVHYTEIYAARTLQLTTAQWATLLNPKTFVEISAEDKSIITCILLGICTNNDQDDPLWGQTQIGGRDMTFRLQYGRIGAVIREQASVSQNTRVWY
ncbi:uncharacterized protein LOC119681881 [Teleopsis dalmanni]|uniref:uncharacterized protein LOC119681881 n=1 Tax=Teleopsis dalmanni TaxID=139649 RepID=UPI0018CF8940|nr:uncharacterized protein LOC119681881 [Teleopsis dalmanni]